MLRLSKPDAVQRVSVEDLPMAETFECKNSASTPQTDTPASQSPPSRPSSATPQSTYPSAPPPLAATCSCASSASQCQSPCRDPPPPRSASAPGSGSRACASSSESAPARPRPAPPSNLVCRSPLYLLHVVSVRPPPMPSMRTRSVPGGTSTSSQSRVAPPRASPMRPRASMREAM